MLYNCLTTEYFMPHILERGIDLANSGNVFIVLEKEHYVEAVVSGTEDYDVILTILESSYDFRCTCPYAAKGYNCKHMAGVLEVLRDKYEDNVVDLKEKLQSLDKDVLVNFLYKQLIRDDNLRTHFHSYFEPQMINEFDLIKDYNNILFRALGRNDFIDYNSATYFFNSLDDFLIELSDVLNEYTVVEVAKVITTITLGFDDLPLDDSAGNTTSFYEKIVELVKYIFSYHNEESDNIIFEWVEQVKASETCWYLQEFVYDFWEYKYTQEEVLEIKLSEAFDTLNNNEEVSSLNIKSAIQTIVSCYEEQGKSKAFILGFLKENETFPSACEILLSHYQSNHDIHFEKVYLEKLIQFESPTYRNRQWFVRLLEIYSDDEVEKRRHVLTMLLYSNVGTRQDYISYRETFETEQWLVKVSEVIKKIKESNSKMLLAEVYGEEGMEAELLELLKKTGFYLADYSHYFCYKLDDYLQACVEYLEAETEYAGSQSKYNSIASFMHEISHVAGGKELMQQLYHHYKNVFRRRKNFMLALDCIFKVTS